MTRERISPAHAELIEQAFPGLRAVAIQTYFNEAWRLLYLTVSGSPEDLIRHGFATSAMLELPPCGYRYYGRQAVQRGRVPFMATIHRNRGGTYRVQRHWKDQEAAQLMDRLGFAVLVPIGNDVFHIMNAREEGATLH